MPDAKVKIIIEGDAKSAVEATDAAVAGIDKVKNATQDQSQITGTATEVNKEHARSFLKLAEGGKELRKVIAAISVQSPLLGVAMKAAMSPVGAALMGALAIYKEISQQIEEDNKKLDEMGEAASRAGTTIAASMRAAKDEIKSLNDEYILWKKTISETTDTQKELDDANLDSVKIAERTTQEKIEAEKNLALAKVKQLENTFQISPAMAEKQRFEIETQAENRQRANSMAAADAEIEIRKQAEERASDKFKLATENTARAKEAASDLTRKAKLDESPREAARLEEEKKRLEDQIQYQQKKTREAEEKADSWWRGGSIELKRLAEIEQKKEAELKAKLGNKDASEYEPTDTSVYARQRRNEENLSKYQREQKSADAALKEWEGKTQAAMTEWDTATRTRSKLEKERAAMGASTSTDQAAEQVIFLNKLYGLNYGKQENPLATIQDAVAALATGRRDKYSQDSVQTATKMLETHGENSTKWLTALVKAANNQQREAALLKALIDRLDAIEQRQSQMVR